MNNIYNNKNMNIYGGGVIDYFFQKNLLAQFSLSLYKYDVKIYRVNPIYSPPQTAE